MNAKRIAKHAPRRGRTNWARFDAISDRALAAASRSDPDAQPTDAKFWKSAKLVMPERKEPITIRIDREVLDWFRARGRRYQTRMNAVLRAYMNAHKRAAPKSRAG